VLTAKFLLSAASASDFPETGFPEIAMVGRSNVGKSTLINALVKATIARTSAAPGKTRLANYYLIESPAPASGSRLKFYLVDLPGYGYARGGREAADEFQALTQHYFDPSSNPLRKLCGVLHLIDARHPELEADARAHEWLSHTGVPMAVVATKMDKLKQSEAAASLKLLRDTYDTSILPASALKGSGLDEIWKVVRGWLREGS
jgi:GTP-binding protein